MVELKSITNRYRHTLSFVLNCIFAPHNSNDIMNRIILPLLSLALFTGAWTADAQNNDALSLQQNAELLNAAYQNKSKKKLELFLDNWSRAVGSNEKDAPNEYVAEAHKVYAAFYQPLNLAAFNYMEMYQDNPYFIVQGKLGYISITDNIVYTFHDLDSLTVEYYKQHYGKEDLENYLELDDDQKERNFRKPDYLCGFFNPFRETSLCLWSIPVEIRNIDSAITFRPSVSFEGKKIVYLTDEYEKLLTSFLKDEHVDLGEYDIMQPAFSIGESKKREAFINRKAHIFYGHWGGYWQYETYPKAFGIIFDEQLQRAVIHYRIVYGGGYAIMEKRDGKWTFVEAHDTWVE